VQFRDTILYYTKGTPEGMFAVEEGTEKHEDVFFLQFSQNSVIFF